mmetsp:Transcript_3388/g.6651  ORF Transcript_3388/g.6651 Transcript_3388/m.6651 type:complete len:442 (+) Transcript_3388:411-1736(+)
MAQGVEEGVVHSHLAGVQYLELRLSKGYADSELHDCLIVLLHQGVNGGLDTVELNERHLRSSFVGGAFLGGQKADEDVFSVAAEKITEGLLFEAGVDVGDVDNGRRSAMRALDRVDTAATLLHTLERGVSEVLCEVITTFSPGLGELDVHHPRDLDAQRLPIHINTVEVADGSRRLIRLIELDKGSVALAVHNLDTEDSSIEGEEVEKFVRCHHLGIQVVDKNNAATLGTHTLAMHAKLSHSTTKAHSKGSTSSATTTTDGGFAKVTTTNGGLRSELLRESIISCFLRLAANSNGFQLGVINGQNTDVTTKQVTALELGQCAGSRRDTVELNKSLNGLAFLLEHSNAKNFSVVAEHLVKHISVDVVGAIKVADLENQHTVGSSKGGSRTRGIHSWLDVELLALRVLEVDNSSSKLRTSLSIHSVKARGTVDTLELDKALAL